MKIDLSELERKLSCGVNLTIKESTILLESMEGFIDDKIELQEQLNTAKKYIDNLEDHLLPYKKEMVQKIIDEKMQLVTADEFLKLEKEYLTAIRENDKLKEQLDTAKKALIEISEIIDYDIYECDYGYDNSCELNSSLDMYLVINSALAEIGEDDEKKIF